MLSTFKFIVIFLHLANAQINLGSFNLNRGNNGDLLLGFGQGGSLFGFGGDRGLQVTIGPGRFGANSNSGLSLGSDRLGVDSTFGIDENRGLSLGSFLNNGHQPSFGNQRTPGGDLGQLLQSLMGAFSSLPTRRPISPQIIPQISGIENRQRIKQVETTSGFVWPTSLGPSIQATTESVFPTLINSWNGEEGEETGSGFMPMGVIDGHGVDGNKKQVTTEGRSGPIVSQGKAEKPDMNSGEAGKRSGEKGRFGPPPPSGLIDIDSQEEFKMRT